MKRLIPSIALSAILLGCPCVAQDKKAPRDGNWWLKATTVCIRMMGGEKLSAPDQDTALEAIAYVDGYYDGVVALSGLTKTPPYRCIPDGITVGQLLRIFKKYLEENPKYLHQSGNLLLLMAMMRAFPCPK